ncbi:MAG: NAD(P)H-binding protein [Anaerolineae bacterium]|nr:NAD(P)H-binding protein [Anaerolineae bacterium]
MIVVTGGGGFVGKALIKRLAQQGEPVRVLSARGERALAGLDETIEIIRGSLHDAESLYHAMVGAHTVFHLASAQWWGRKRDLERVDVQGTQNVIAAGRSARIGRLVVLSHLGAEPSSAFTLLRVKGRVEELVRNSGLAYTIFRSGIVFGRDDTFVNGIAQLLRANPLIFLQPGRGESLLHPLYIGDLVEALVRSMEHLDTVDQTLSIGGPEYMTFNEMVRTVMRVTRAPRLIVSVPPWTLRALANLISRFFPYFPLTPQWLDLLASNRTASMSALYDLFEMQPRRFEDTIVTYMRGRRYRLELLRATLRRRPRRIA